MSGFTKGASYRNKTSKTLVSIINTTATTVIYSVNGMSHPQKLAVSVFNNIFEKV